MQFVGAAKLAAGRDEEAVVWLNRSIELNPIGQRLVFGSPQHWRSLAVLKRRANQRAPGSN
jgi:hypothetical protein